MTPMAEGDAPVAIDSEVSGTSDRVPAGRTGWDVRGSGSCATAWVADGGVVEVGSEVDIGTEISDTRLLWDCYVGGGLRGRGEGSDGG